MLRELRLERATHNLCDLHRLLNGARCLRVRYNRTHLICLYVLA